MILYCFILLIHLFHVGVILVDKLKDVFSKQDVVWNLSLTLRQVESHVLNRSLSQKLIQILLLQLKLLDGFLRIELVGRDLVEDSAHHSPNDSLLEFVHGLF